MEYAEPADGGSRDAELQAKFDEVRVFLKIGDLDVVVKKRQQK